MQITHNYCKECRKFRKLFDLTCSRCLGYEPKENLKIIDSNNVSIEKKIKKEKSEKKKRNKRQKLYCSILKQVREYEENLLIKYLENISRQGEYWRGNVAKELNWTTAKVNIVAKRCYRKNPSLKKTITSDELVLNLLEKNPQGLTPREIKIELKYKSITSLYNVLQRLLKLKKITRKRHNNNTHSVYIVL